MADEIKPNEKDKAPVSNEPKLVLDEKTGKFKLALTDTTSNPVFGQGTLLEITASYVQTYGSSSSSVATDINVVKIQRIKLPNTTSKDLETTGMSDWFEQFMPGWINIGEAEFEILYLKSQSATLQSLINMASVFKITLPDGRIKTFNGFINSFGEEVDLKALAKTTIKVRTTSVVVNS